MSRGGGAMKDDQEGIQRRQNFSHPIGFFDTLEEMILKISCLLCLHVSSPHYLLALKINNWQIGNFAGNGCEIPRVQELLKWIFPTYGFLLLCTFLACYLYDSCLKVSLCLAGLDNSTVIDLHLFLWTCCQPVNPKGLRPAISYHLLLGASAAQKVKSPMLYCRGKQCVVL